MIWAAEQFSGDRTASAVDAIVEQLQELCGQVMPAVDEKLDDVACAIERALADHGEASIRDSSTVLALASQALTSIGEEEAARRLFLFGSGTIRPSEWSVSGEDTLWVLDMRSLTWRSHPLLELQVVSGVHRILESICDLWDESDGHGVLGVSNLAACEADFPSRAGSRRHRFGDEVLTTCAGKLKCIANGRGWSETPVVMNLDIWRSQS